jgi:hypothetical protein
MRDSVNWAAAGRTAASNARRLLAQCLRPRPRSAVLQADAAAAPAEQFKAALNQNTRKPVARILHYYKGVAAMRAGNRDAARAAWLSAQNSGLTSPRLTENLTALLRGEAVELAQEGRWQDLVNLISRLPAPGADRIVAETGSLAYYHLGYDAAQAGKWSVAAQHWR